MVTSLGRKGKQEGAGGDGAGRESASDHPELVALSFQKGERQGQDQDRMRNVMEVVWLGERLRSDGN